MSTRQSNCNKLWWSLHAGNLFVLYICFDLSRLTMPGSVCTLPMFSPFQIYMPRSVCNLPMFSPFQIHVPWSICNLPMFSLFQIHVPRSVCNPPMFHHSRYTCRGLFVIHPCFTIPDTRAEVCSRNTSFSSPSTCALRS